MLEGWLERGGWACTSESATVATAAASAASVASVASAAAETAASASVVAPEGHRCGWVVVLCSEGGVAWELGSVMWCTCSLIGVGRREVEVGVVGRSVNKGGPLSMVWERWRCTV